MKIKHIGNNIFLKANFITIYNFHTARLEGTKKPNSVCDVMFYGANNPARGLVHNPSSSLLWNMEGALTCSYLFVPAVNQSLTITVSKKIAHCKKRLNMQLLGYLRFKKYANIDTNIKFEKKIKIRNKI